MSVESRLLEWRRRATTHLLEEEKTVYAPLRGNEVDDDSNEGSSDDESDGESDDESAGGDDGVGDGDDDVVEEDAVKEENQTRFLLGLSTTTTTTTEAGNNNNQTEGMASTTTVTRRQIRTTNQRAGTFSDPILL